MAKVESDEEQELAKKQEKDTKSTDQEKFMERMKQKEMQDRRAGWMTVSINVKEGGRNYRRVPGGIARPISGAGDPDDPFVWQTMIQFHCDIEIIWPSPDGLEFTAYIAKAFEGEDGGAGGWKGTERAEWAGFEGAVEQHEGEHAKNIKKSYAEMKQNGELPETATGLGQPKPDLESAKSSAYAAAQADMRKKVDQVRSKLYEKEKGFDKHTDHGGGPGSNREIKWPQKAGE